jgi:replicative DNA helicase
VQEVTEITTSLMALGQGTQRAGRGVVALSRQVENRDDKRPQLRTCANPARSSKTPTSMFVFREEYYLSNKEPRPAPTNTTKWQVEMAAVHGKAEIIIGKQRHGPTGTVQLQFEAQVTRFDDLTRDERMPERIDR